MSEQHEPDEPQGPAEDAPGPSDDEQSEDEAAEQEQADTDAVGQTTPAAAPKSEKEIDKALKAVERAGTSYRNAIGRAMGEDAQALEVCPRCNAPVAGMIFPPDVAPVDDDTRLAVLASLGIGEGGASPLKPAKGVHECETCDGYGLLAFPTKVPHVQEQQCPKCNGSGYVLDTNEEKPALYAAPPLNTPPPTAPVPVSPCPICGMPEMAGHAHFCNPASAAGGA